MKFLLNMFNCLLARLCFLPFVQEKGEQYQRARPAEWSTVRARPTDWSTVRARPTEWSTVRARQTEWGTGQGQQSGAQLGQGQLSGARFLRARPTEWTTLPKVKSHRVDHSSEGQGQRSGAQCSYLNVKWWIAEHCKQKISKLRFGFPT